MGKSRWALLGNLEADVDNNGDGSDEDEGESDRKAVPC